MAINMNDVKTLRAKTGAGFADCKKAIEEAQGNLDEAETLLKKMGLAAAAKRDGRATGEGSIFTAANDTHAVILELACETDFVARNDEFQALGNELCNNILENKIDSITEELTNKVTSLIGKIKENMSLKKLSLIEKKDNEIFSHYVHGKPARLGAVVTVSCEDAAALSNEKLLKFAQSCVLHAVARTPIYLSPETVDETYKTSQMDIFAAQVAEMGKPENIAQGITQGKWKKHLNEICFELQPWVHNDKSTPKLEMENLSKEIGSKVTITNFVVYVLGS